MNPADRNAVVDLLTELWFDIDHHGGPRAHTMFTDDGRLTFDARSFTGRDQIRQVYLDRTSRGPRTSLHVVTNVRIHEVDDRAAQVTSIVSLYAADGGPPVSSTMPTCIADVEDRVVKAGDEWLIASRRWRSLFRAADAVLAVPTR